MSEIIEGKDITNCRGKLLDSEDDEDVTRSVLLNSRNGPLRIRKLASTKWTELFSRGGGGGGRVEAISTIPIFCFC